MQEWMTRRANRARPFSYAYPELPPQFRRWRGISRLLCLAGFWTGSIAALGLLAAGALHWLFGRPASDGTLAVIALLSGLSFILWWVFRLLQLTPRLYWHCPVCRERFPYYKPTRYGDHLVGEDCLRELKFCRIPYVRPRFCSLILPSECPYCGKKFFEYRKEEKE
mgnify:CR=1 FL=1